MVGPRFASLRRERRLRRNKEGVVRLFAFSEELSWCGTGYCTQEGLESNEAGAKVVLQRCDTALTFDLSKTRDAWAFYTREVSHNDNELSSESLVACSEDWLVRRVMLVFMHGNNFP